MIGVRSVSVEPASRETTVHSIDQVGNVLTHRIKWCRVHTCPARIFGDGSFDCWHDATVGWSPHEHAAEDIVPGPWEVAGVPDTEKAETVSCPLCLSPVRAYRRPWGAGTCTGSWHDGPDGALPVRCPSCGSDDPKVRGEETYDAAEGTMYAGSHYVGFQECSDPWHDGVTGDTR